MAQPAVQYVGFWARVGATIIDSFVLLIPLTILFAVLGLQVPAVQTGDDGWPVLPPDYWRNSSVQGIVIAAVTVAFWAWRLATPGKMVIGAVIVKADSFAKPGTATLVLRYLAYFVSIFPLFLGLLWVGWDRRKQGWHDKIAGTVVVKKASLAAVAAPAAPQ